MLQTLEMTIFPPSRPSHERLSCLQGSLLIISTKNSVYNSAQMIELTITVHFSPTFSMIPF